MARGTQLQDLLAKFRAEARLSRNVSHHSSTEDAQIQLLSRHQERLWGDHDWPNLRVHRYIPLVAGQRYYDPTAATLLDGTAAGDISLDRLQRIQVRHGGQWDRVHPGIHPDHYNTWDSDAGEQSWPVERWAIAEDEKIEVWPIPADSASDLEGMLRLTGIRNLSPLSDYTDTADIDDNLIVLHAAAEHLAGTGAKDAQLKLEQAVRKEQMLTGHFQKVKQWRLFGGSPNRGRQLRGMPRVHYRTED